MASGQTRPRGTKALGINEEAEVDLPFYGSCPRAPNGAPKEFRLWKPGKLDTSGDNERGENAGENPEERGCVA